MTRDEIRNKTLDAMLPAIDHLAVVDLSDKVLGLLHRRLEELSRGLDMEGEHEASAVTWALGFRFLYEKSYRRSQMENARIEVEGNGHGVTVSHDSVHEDKCGAGWFAMCRCSDEWANPARHGRVWSSREDAIEAAQRHVQETGGLWLGDMSQP